MQHYPNLAVDQGGLAGRSLATIVSENRPSLSQYVSSVQPQSQPVGGTVGEGGYS